MPKPPPGQPCWVFDVDGCLVDSLTGTSLRPGARTLLEHFDAVGATVLLWSAGGGDYARARAAQFHLDGLVAGCFGKEARDAGAYRTDHLPLAGRDPVFVDDRPEDLADDLEVIPVAPYLSDDASDRGLEVVARRVGIAAFGTGVRAGADVRTGTGGA